MRKQKLKIIFYCNDSIENIKSMEYYNQDIKALENLGHEVIICNSYFKIPMNFDIIYIWWWTYALFPILLSKLLGKKSIVTGVFNYSKVKHLPNSGFHARPRYQRLLIKSACKLADINLFVSKIEFDEVPRVFDLKKYFYFPCAIADLYFLGNNNSVREGILNFAWSGKDNLKRKGIFDLLGAIKILKEKNVFIKCTLGGRKGDGFNDLLNFINENKLNDRINLVGEVSHQKKIELFQSSLLYVQPSYFEGFGLATAEALASGCAVIACDVGEVKNVLGSGAQYVETGNKKELAKMIEKLYSDAKLRKKLVSSGNKRIVELFSQKKKKESLNKILKFLFE